MVPFTSLHLDARRSAPLHRQLYAEIRGAVLSGRLAAGARLPSTRSLAADLGVSRNTVAGAFDQLMAEGYLEGKVGSGTFVTDLGAKASGGAAPHSGRRDAALLSARGRMLAQARAALHGGGNGAGFPAGCAGAGRVPARIVGPAVGARGPAGARGSAELRQSGGLLSAAAGHCRLSAGGARRALFGGTGDRDGGVATGLGPGGTRVAGRGRYRLGGRSRLPGRAWGVRRCRA